MEGDDIKKLLDDLAKEYPEIYQKQELIKIFSQWLETATEFGSDSSQSQDLMQNMAKLDPEIAQTMQELIVFGEITRRLLEIDPDFREEIKKFLEPSNRENHLVILNLIFIRMIKLQILKDEKS